MFKFLQRRRERRAVGYLTGLAAYADECARKRAEAGILCPQGTPGCTFVSCGPWPGGECSTMPQWPRDNYGFLLPATSLTPSDSTERMCS